jgi:hypothetical protein
MKKTQHEKILDYMRKYGSITTLEAAMKLHITKLTTRISELRDLGLNIVGIPEKSKNEAGEVSHYNRYFLENAKSPYN